MINENCEWQFFLKFIFRIFQQKLETACETCSVRWSLRLASVWASVSIVCWIIWDAILRTSSPSGSRCQCNLEWPPFELTHDSILNNIFIILKKKIHSKFSIWWVNSLLTLSCFFHIHNCLILQRILTLWIFMLSKILCTGSYRLAVVHSVWLKFSEIILPIAEILVKFCQFTCLPCHPSCLDFSYILALQC